MLSTAEDLADQRGLDNSWLTPHPAGASLTIGLTPGTRHRDTASGPLGGTARVVVDGTGVAGSALKLEAPDASRAGEVVGRAWCQIDLIGMGRVLLLEGEGN